MEILEFMEIQEPITHETTICGTDLTVKNTNHSHAPFSRWSSNVAIFDESGTRASGWCESNTQQNALKGAMDMAFGQLIRESENPVNGITLLVNAWKEMIERWTQQDDSA